MCVWCVKDMVVGEMSPILPWSKVVTDPQEATGVASSAGAPGVARDTPVT